MSSDYSNTIIYKISCNNSDVTDVYVGHTTDFVKRKYAHGKSSMDADYTNKLYTTIREHGGWHNWNMKIIGFFDCKNLTEAREKEQEFFVSLGATLNSIEPLPERKKAPESEKKILDTNVNLKLVVAAKYNSCKVRIAEQTPGKFREDLCYKACDYIGTCPANFSKHKLTLKHMNVSSKSEKQSACKTCGKEYTARNSLWYHENKCKPVKMKEPDISDKIEKLMADNQTILNFVTEQYHKTNKLLQMHMCHNATVDPPVVL